MTSFLPRLFTLISLLVCLSLGLSAQGPHETFAPGRLVVLYRDTLPSHPQSHHFTTAILRLTPGTEEATIAQLMLDPQVETVLRDRYITAHTFPLRTAPLPHDNPNPRLPINITATNNIAYPLTDRTYNSPAAWPILSAGGFGDNIHGGPAIGPWTITRGAGVRIAILDSGVDAHHPDLAAALALNLSEVNPADLPSTCDDASPQDQQGHGTWTASLAAAALGADSGDLVGVAPQATLLNIKVLERLPAPAGTSLTAQCEAGQPGGLLSWVLAGIDDAIANHANVISLSLGTLVDITTGDGAGWKATFDRATYAATQAGVVIIASAGNDGLNLSGPQYLELPAQARDVLAVTASTNPACAEDLTPNATCHPGPIARPYYSNYGTTLNAIAAPGGSYPVMSGTAVSGGIYGACTTGLTNTTEGLPANGQSFGCYNLGHTAYMQAIGTSAAAPLVAGAAAILHAARPEWSATQIIAALRTSATKVPTMTEPQLNLPTALALP